MQTHQQTLDWKLFLDNLHSCAQAGLARKATKWCGDLILSLDCATVMHQKQDLNATEGWEVAD